MINLRPFRTDIPIEITFSNMFSPIDKTCSVYVLCYNSMNKGEVYRTKLELSGEGLVRTTVFPGNLQRKMGGYSLQIVLNESLQNMAQKIIPNVFHLTPFWDEVYDPNTLLVRVDVEGNVTLRPVYWVSGQESGPVNY